MNRVNDKLLNWASQLDDNSLQQATATASMHFVERVALMPDAHLGRGSTVGSVIGTNGAIMPAAVGVDIGCGMAAVEFDLEAKDLPENLKDFLHSISRAIPAGVAQGHTEQSKEAVAWFDANKKRFSTELTERMQKKIIHQYGTLGSGNHFFELSLDERDKVWIVLHSGSRGIGNMLASRHIDSAKKLAEVKQYKLPNDDLAWFEENSEGFNLYIADMLACQDYAAANRHRMLMNAVDQFNRFMKRDVAVKRFINCHHNFTQKETHGGKELWITRKGAISARDGELGIIPGSMGTRSYIVAGRGNPLSFNSCSHGAGRNFSRGEAKRRFTKEDLAKAMEGKVWQDGMADRLIDEIPQAYKDIDQVMEDQKDLVEPVHTLRQILNYKGT